MKCRRWKRQKGVKLAVSLRRRCLETAMTRARAEEDEFFQAVPQDETMKERQTAVYFREVRRC